MFATNRMLTQLDPWGLWNQINNDLHQLCAAPLEEAEAPLNLWTSDDKAVVTVEVPGREPGDVEVSVHRDVLTVEIKELADETPEEAKPGRRERRSGPVTRQVRLPFVVDQEQVEAVCDKGLLKVTLQRHESTMPSQVEVKAG